MDPVKKGRKGLDSEDSAWRWGFVRQQNQRHLVEIRGHLGQEDAGLGQRRSKVSLGLRRCGGEFRGGGRAKVIEGPILAFAVKA